MSRAPVHVVRIGLVKATIWLNQTSYGERHSVSLVRLYRDGDAWAESTRFGRDELPVVAKAADLAFAWIWERNTLPEGGNND